MGVHSFPSTSYLTSQPSNPSPHLPALDPEPPHQHTCDVVPSLPEPRSRPLGPGATAVSTSLHIPILIASEVSPSLRASLQGSQGQRREKKGWVRGRLGVESVGEG